MILLINKENGHTIPLNSKQQLLDRLEHLEVDTTGIDLSKSVFDIGSYRVSRSSYPLYVVTKLDKTISSEVFTNPRQVINYFKTVEPLTEEQKDMLDDCIWFNHGKWLITFTTM